MILTLDNYRKIRPAHLPVSDLAIRCLEEINRIGETELQTKDQKAQFLAHALHESTWLTDLTENLNYSAKGLRKTWPSRFAGAQGAVRATNLARNPLAIANYVYANRLGNGDPASGEGWKYRGRGIFMVTGKDNYATASVELFGGAAVLVENPDALTRPDYAVRSALLYWRRKKMGMVAPGNLQASTYKLNGGYIGLDKRIALYELVKPYVS